MSFAHCDIENNKIFGCQPKTFAWFHEEGHLVYNSTEKTSRLNLIRGIIFDLWIVSTTLSLFFNLVAIMSLILMLLYVTLGQVEEVWCNRYARMKLKELKNDKTN